MTAFEHKVIVGWARAGARIEWLDLEARAPMAPPPEMLAALQSLARTDDVVVLDSSVKRGS